MVTPISELANKHLSITSISSKVSNMAYLLSNADMDIEDNIRERSTSSSKATSRSVSVSSVASSYIYCLRMEYNNNFLDKMEVNPINSSYLLYSDDVEKEGNLISKATDPGLIRNSQHILYNTLVLNKASKPQGKGVFINNTNMSPLQDNVINIQLPYDLNRLTEVDL